MWCIVGLSGGPIWTGGRRMGISDKAAAYCDIHDKVGSTIVVIRKRAYSVDGFPPIPTNVNNHYFSNILKYCWDDDRQCILVMVDRLG